VGKLDDPTLLDLGHSSRSLMRAGREVTAVIAVMWVIYAVGLNWLIYAAGSLAVRKAYHTPA